MATAGGTVVVDLDALGTAITAAETAAGLAQRSASGVQAATQRSGPAPWGDDPALGQAFDAVFSAPRAALVEAVRELSSVLQGVAESLATTRRVYARTDDATRTVAEALARRLADSRPGSP